MEREQFTKIRQYLQKTQKQLAALLCISIRTVQSIEQGLRKIPANTERQLLFLLSLKMSTDLKQKPCWEIRNCPEEQREKCAAWEFKAGQLCWYINGTYCHGENQGEWDTKINICRDCDVFSVMMTSIEKLPIKK